jgi:GNAT superfamily N-acetyltransferase
MTANFMNEQYNIERIKIRPATESDLPVLIRLLSQLTSITIENAEPVFRKMASYPSYHAYLAFIDDVAIGTFSLLMMDNLGHDSTPIAILENVVVDKAMRRSGIGQQMMKFAESTSKEYGCYKMLLASNMTLNDAHHFYESLGFTKQGYAFSLELTKK